MPQQANGDNPVDLAQNLMGHLDGSAGDFNALGKALDSLSNGDIAGLDLPAMRDAVENADAHLDAAWDLLEDGTDEDAPLLSDDYIDWDDPDSPEFRDPQRARKRLGNILDHFEVAAGEIDIAYGLVTESDAEISASELDGDLGVHDTLESYMEYVHSDVLGMLDLARRARDSA